MCFWNSKFLFIDHLPNIMLQPIPRIPQW
jgi:hypothetical protein